MPITTIFAQEKPNYYQSEGLKNGFLKKYAYLCTVYVKQI